MALAIAALLVLEELRALLSQRVCSEVLLLKALSWETGAL